jgi:pimeloyl-[acyl-carrier protein] methyl ester esterase
MRDLVLVHGWGFGAAVWLPVVAQLPATMRVHRIDLPAYGSGEFSPEMLPANAVVCGWSLGALHALQWAQRYPDKVARLVLVGATPRFVQAPDWPWAQAPALLDEFASAVAANAMAALRRFAALLNRGDRRARQLTREMSALLDANVPTTACLLEGLATLRTTDLRTAVAGIRQPALVIHGEHDPLMPLAAGRWLSEQLTGGRIEVFEGAAHAPFLSDRQRFAAAIAAFADE